jgi:hypothetical protein
MARSTPLATTLLVTLVLGSATAGCGLLTSPDSPPARPRLEGQITARANSGVSGVSYVYSTADRSIVTLRVGSAAAAVPLDWRLRTGRCSEADGVTFGNASAYPVLVPGENGKDRTLATFDVPLSAAGSYRVEVLSREEPPQIIGCGDLTTPPPGG